MSKSIRLVAALVVVGAACAPSRALVQPPSAALPPDARTASAAELLDARIGPTPGPRLPEGVRPTAYRATLEINAAKDSLSGKIEIDLAVSAPAQVVWLN